MSVDKDKAGSPRPGGKPAAKTVVGVPAIPADRPSDASVTRPVPPQAVDDEVPTAMDAKAMSAQDAERVLSEKPPAVAGALSPKPAAVTVKTPPLSPDLFPGLPRGARGRLEPESRTRAGVAPQPGIAPKGRSTLLLDGSAPPSMTSDPTADGPPIVVPASGPMPPKAVTQPPPWGEGAAHASPRMLPAARPPRPAESAEEISASMLLPPDASGESLAGAAEELSGSLLIEDAPDGKGPPKVTQPARPGSMPPAARRPSVKPPVPRSASVPPPMVHARPSSVPPPLPGHAAAPPPSPRPPSVKPPTPKPPSVRPAPANRTALGMPELPKTTPGPRLEYLEQGSRPPPIPPALPETSIGAAPAGGWAGAASASGSAGAPGHAFAPAPGFAPAHGAPPAPALGPAPGDPTAHASATGPTTTLASATGPATTLASATGPATALSSASGLATAPASASGPAHAFAGGDASASGSGPGHATASGPAPAFASGPTTASGPGAAPESPPLPGAAVPDAASADAPIPPPFAGGLPSAAPLTGDIELTHLPRSPVDQARDVVRRLRDKVLAAVAESGVLRSNSRPPWFLPAVAVGGVVVGVAIVGLLVSAFRGGSHASDADTSPSARASASASPSSASAIPAPESSAVAPTPASVACALRGTPHVIAPGATVAAGVEVATSGEDVAIGFAPDDKEAMVVRLDPSSLSAGLTAHARAHDTVRRVSPLLTKGGGLSLVVDTDRKGDKLQGRRAVRASSVYQFGATADGHLAWAKPGGPPSGALWSVDPAQPIDALRGSVDSSGDPTIAIAFRSGGAVWTGTVAGTGGLATSGPLSHIDGLGTTIGSPAVAISNSIVMVAWADRPSNDAPWHLRWTRFIAGSAAGSANEFTPPAGGKGEPYMSPAIAPVPGGRFLLVWTEGPASGHVVRALTVGADGAPVGAPLDLSDEASNAGEAQAAINEAGDGVVAYLQSGGKGFEVAAITVSCGQH